MPIYEYQCEQCDQRTEAIQRLDEPPLELCPHCGGTLRKLMSAPSFQFKGTGWYVTDYADKKRNDGKGSSKSGKSATDGATAKEPSAETATADSKESTKSSPADAADSS